MNITKLLKTKYGKYIISIIFGLGLASLFRKICDKKSCLSFMGPKFKDIKDNVYKYNNQCIKFTENIVNCNSPNKKIINFA